MESKNCVYCKQEINPLRIKALPNTKTCVDCSTVGAKKGMSMVFGEKDHTWNDMIIVEPEEVNRLENNRQPEFIPFDKMESNDELNDDSDDDMKLWDNALLDGLEDI